MIIPAMPDWPSTTIFSSTEPLNSPYLLPMRPNAGSPERCQVSDGATLRAIVKARATRSMFFSSFFSGEERNAWRKHHASPPL